MGHERYDIQTNTWTYLTDLNTGKCGLSPIPTPKYEKFYTIGGEHAPNKASKEIEVYDIEKDEFLTLDVKLSKRRALHSSLVSFRDDKLYNKFFNHC